MARSVLLVVAAFLGVSRAWAADCTDADLLAGRRVLLASSVSGPTARLTDGEIASEGGRTGSTLAVQFDTVDASVVWDLRDPVTASAVVVQADAGHSFELYATDNLRTWTKLGEVPKATDGAGLRTRVIPFDAPVTLRGLRIANPSDDNGAALAEVGLYCSTPAPPAYGFKRTIPPPETRVQPWLNNTSAARIAGVLGAVGLVVVAIDAWLTRAGRPVGRRVRRVLLALLGLTGFALFPNFGKFHWNDLVHTWDGYHYYIGAKYFPELGYDRLYECTTVADYEAGLERRVESRRITDLKTDLRGPTDIWKHPGDCKDHFSPARWTAFTDDIRWFRGVNSAKRWESILGDHGYNATPVWTLAGSALSNLWPATHTTMVRLASVDLALYAGMFLGVIWAFGWETAAVAILVFATNFPSRWEWTGGSILRWDWLFWMMASIVLLKKERPMLAGFALAYSAMLRIFPGFVFAGAVLQAIQEWRSGRLGRTWPRFFAGAALGVLILVPASLLAVGVDGWVEFFENTRKHAQTPLTNNMGWRYVLSCRPDSIGRVMKDARLPDAWGPWKAQHLANWASWPTRIVYAGSLVGLGVLLWRAVRGAPPWLAVALGVAVIPFAPGELTCYYYMLLAGLAVAWAADRRVGVWLLGATTATQFIAWAPLPGMPGWDDERYFWMSLVTLIAVVGILVQRGRSALAGANVHPARD